MALDYIKGRKILENTFAEVEITYLNGQIPKILTTLENNIELIFTSGTQAYREALLGCSLARILEKKVNVRHPYSDQSQNAFSGRTLDEKVVNPFLQSRNIPSSKGPYLSVFRRSVKFEKKTGKGLRDVKGYNAFLNLISYLEKTSTKTDLNNFLFYLLCKFLQLREESLINLTKLQRISLEQFDRLITGLLSLSSGGRVPLILVVAAFNTIIEYFNLNWEISWQGINVSDAASGVGGDITIKNKNETVLAIEVTERPLDKERILTTFNTKIASAGIENYLFLLKKADIPPEVKQQARQYFAQGNEINFVEIKNWILMLLATVGAKGRAVFNEMLIKMLTAPDIPKTLKVKWNEQIKLITTL
ncbi:MAG: restriction endonuclease, SacI family [Dehalococcoidales bacterium]